ncbi:lipid II flippase MurJ, partial [Enterococcus casseliflavus]|uniref:lipid II flippase MurJ n=1 Tax=Enterococcus casseliflavus TaxID=37734 RepID=UPI003D0AB0D3
SGFTYRPRFDFRDPELRKTLSLGIWTVLFVVVTQAAYLVVVRLASGGAVDGGTGYLVYSNSLLIMMVPHAIVTVSLATAILPRLSSYAHEGRL